MMEMDLIRILFSLGLFFAANVICHLFPRRWVWLGAICSFVSVFLLVFNSRYGLFQGIMMGGIFGLLISFAIVMTGQTTYENAKRGWKELGQRIFPKRTK
jgi:hypothetical protein